MHFAHEQRRLLQGREMSAARRAHEDGDLPPDSDPEALALLLMTVANGVAVQAAGGQAPDALHQVVDAVLQAWPSP